LIGCHAPDGWGASGALLQAAKTAASEMTMSVLMEESVVEFG